MNGEWSYNKTADGIWGNDFFPVREEAIEAGREDYPDEDFYIGKCEQIKIPTMNDAEETIMRISRAINDDYGSELDFDERFYEDAIEHCEELDEELEKVVKAWLNRHKFCKECFVIKDTELIVWPF